MRPLLLALAVLLAAPAAASATLYRGETSDGRKASLTTNGSGAATRATVAWETMCNKGGNLFDDTVIRFGDDGTRVKDSYFIPDTGEFRIKVTFDYRASQKSDGSWKGSFKAKGVVRQDGAVLDRCTQPKVTFSVA